MQEITLVFPTITSNPRRKQESARGVTLIALKTGMRILWDEGVVLPCGGVGEWVVSGNKGYFCFFVSVCTSGVFDRAKELLN